MTFLPIVDRELRVAARLTGTYKKRAFAAAIVAAVAMIMLVFGGFSSFPSQVGHAMFSTLSFLILVFCLLEGVRKTADCLSVERREGTLGLLFLTDLKGYDVVLGKLAATSLNSIYGLLAMLPILALSLLLGGVTEGEFWRMTAALTNLLFFSLTAGIWVSARSRSDHRALLGTFSFISICLAAPLFTGASPVAQLSPIQAFRAVPEAAYRAMPASFLRSLLATQFVSWMLLAWASLSVSRFQEYEAVSESRLRWRERRQRWQFGDAARRAKLGAELLQLNPAAWLASRSLGRGLLLSVPGAILLVGFNLLLALAGVDFFGVFLATSLILNFSIKIVLAFQACRCFAEARRNNALEMLLCTPLTVEEMLQGQIIALKRAFMLPVALVLVIEAIGLFAGIQILGGHDLSDKALAFGGWAVGVPVYVGLFVLDLTAVAWAGMWFGLSSRNGTQAAFKTILYVLILPAVFTIFYCLAIPYFLIWAMVCVVVAREKLRTRFRTIATQPFEPAEGASSGWWPFQRKARKRVPPRIPPPVAPPTILSPHDYGQPN